MDSIVLAGGFAKRMLPLTKNTPKQLLDVAGEPMLSHVLKSLEEISPERVIISVNSFFSSHFSQFIDDYSGPLNLQLFVESSENEEEKLGALGALNLLFSELNITGPVFIAGGDNLSNFDLSAMVSKSERTNRDVIGLYDVEDNNLAKLYGIAELKSDRIVDFVEKPSEPKSTLAATAYWLLSTDGISNFFDYINSGGDRDALGNFLAWNIKRNEVLSVSYRGTWYDIGDLESYKAAQKWLSE
ncbi:MAG: NTP transferase domain-containing protein [Candidatus Poseidoniia archaeon]|nr:NTP transferase domain-containing protein [Candidatus Poseidoniia archaeon]